MSFHSDLVGYLQDDATVRQYIRGGVFSEFVPQGQGTFPVLVITLISNVETDVDQDYPNNTKIIERRYQFDVQGKTTAEVVEAVEAIDAMLVAFNGAMGATSIQMVERTGQRDLSNLDGDKLRRRISTDYTFWY